MPRSFEAAGPEHTATGIVTDSHGIPFSFPAAATGPGNRRAGTKIDKAPAYASAAGHSAHFRRPNGQPPGRLPTRKAEKWRFFTTFTPQKQERHHGCKNRPRLESHPRTRVREALFRRADPLRARGVRLATHLSARQQHLPRLRQVPLRAAQGGHHRAGPLPRSGAGQRALLLGGRRRPLPSFAAEHLQGGERRHGGALPLERQP